jgi:hypothetical protein
MVTSQELLTKSQACIEWYWQHGMNRTHERYQIEKGTWLDTAYQCRNQARGLIAAETVAKPCMALWGPSQTGKSTLLSSYLDLPDDDEGHKSALKWSDNEPVRFVIGKNKSEHITVLNPFNFGSDASGCVSRFTLRDNVSDVEHPVEVVLASERQILHALAVGYLSECKPCNTKNEATDWNSDSFTTLLAAQKVSGPPQRAAFEFLQQVAEMLDLLIMSEHTRYPNLKENWIKSLRSKMLSCPGLQGSVEQVETFAFELLWDSWPSLTQTYKALAAKRRELSAQWGAATVRCSYRVAAVLLDIDSFKKASGNQEIRRRMDALSVRVSDGVATIDHASGSSRLVRDVTDFGWFQGLVWELHFSLRQDVLRQRAPALCKFFETADLMDFPGVANSHGSADLHTNEKVAASPLIALTEVLKRGKTASIVVTRARSMDIDGFSLLMRLGNFPAQPRQLVSGITSWLDAYGHNGTPQSKLMPINLTMTFCAKLVNQIIQSGTQQGLQPCFDQLKSLGWLSDPKVVTAVATTYPQFREGLIDGSEGEKQGALEAILKDVAFHERFGDTAESFREMFANGGTDYFFRQLTVQAQQTRRGPLLAARLAETSQRLVQLISEHLPSEVAATEERNRVIDSWRDGIVERLKQRPASETDLDSCTKLSAHLRRFLNVDPEELDEIPPNAIRARLPVRSFIEKQFRIWQSRRTNWPTLHDVGLKDGQHAQRLLSYLIDATDISAIETFFKDNLGHLSARVDCKQCRRYLAAQMSNDLHRGSSDGSTHRSLEGVPELLNRLADSEDRNDLDPKNSPHYSSVIAPLLVRLEMIKTTSVQGRPAQPGDAELSRLAQLS